MSHHYFRDTLEWISIVKLPSPHVLLTLLVSRWLLLCWELLLLILELRLYLLNRNHLNWVLLCLELL